MTPGEQGALTALVEVVRKDLHRRCDAQDGVLREVRDQVRQTNGRVSALEVELEREAAAREALERVAADAATRKRDRWAWLADLAKITAGGGLVGALLNYKGWA